MALVWALVFIASVAALVKGADFLLDTAKKVGEWLGLSPFVIGVVIIGFGTSLPELVSSFAAQWQSVSEIVAGNVVGSNIANILLIAGFAAVIGRGVVLKMQDLNFDIAWMVAAAGVYAWMARDLLITQAESAFLLFGFLLYGAAIYATSRDNPHKAAHQTPRPVAKDWALLIVGFILLVGGAHFTVESATHIAAIIHVGAGIVGLLAIALGTSLPELAVTMQAARKKEADIAIGNIFGSNVFNVLLVIGLPGLVGPIVVDTVTGTMGLLVMLAATLLFAWLGFRRTIPLALGVAMLCTYGLFVLLVAGVL